MTAAIVVVIVVAAASVVTAAVVTVFRTQESGLLWGLYVTNIHDDYEHALCVYMHIFA